MTIITAHSGCEGTPIDSLESIDKALELGAEAIEVDVRVDPAGSLRISHNALTDDEAPGKLLFRDVLEKIRGTNLAVNCDIKEQRALYQVMSEADRFGLERERLILSGCTGPEQLARDGYLTKRARIFLNIEEVLKFLYLRMEKDFRPEHFHELMNDPWIPIREKGPDLYTEYASAALDLFRVLRPDAANLPKNLISTPLFIALLNEGIPLSVWTVKEPEIVRRCLALGVYNITTRDVRQAAAIRNQQTGHEEDPFS